MSGIFVDAVKKREEAKAREDRKKANNFENFEQVKKMFLQYGKEARREKVFRICGKPLEMREKATDPKLVFFSRLVADGGKGYTKITWKTKINDLGIPELDEDWILFRLYNKVMESDWRDFTEEEKAANDNKKGEYVHRHMGAKSYARINSNKREGEKYPPQFYPKKRVLINVIDRMDDWCVQNKHSKVLFASGSPYEFTNDKNEKINIEYINELGIPFLAYGLFFDNVIKFHNHWDIDIICKATGQMNNAYEVRDITEQKIEEFSKQVGKEEPMTQEELAYELYDLDKIYAESSYTKLYKKLSGLFKMVDVDFNTSFYDELVSLLQEESDRALEEKKRKEAEAGSTDKKSEEPVKEDIKKEPERQARVSREEKEKNLEDDFIKAFPNWLKLDAEDKADIMAGCLKFENSIPVWKEGINLAPCDDSNCCYKDSKITTNVPSTVLHCPVCGITFKTS